MQVENLLTVEDHEQILRNRYGSSSPIKYVSSEIKPLSENVEGLLGEHYKLMITYERDGVTDVGQFFIKTMPTKHEAQTSICEKLHIYDKEIFLFDVLIKKYKEKGYDVSFAAKSYLCKNGKTLVLEDLQERGFQVPKRRCPYTLSQMECVLYSLAKFHGNSLLYEEEQSKTLKKQFRMNDQYGKLLADILYSHDNEITINFLSTALVFGEYVIDSLKEPEEFKEDFKKMFKTIDFRAIFHEENAFRKTIGHGDLWSNNMMFRYKNKVVEKCCLLDFQQLGYYHPGYDVAIAILENTNSSFRKKYLDYLLHYYFSCLSDLLKEFGYSIENILPLDDFLAGFKHLEYVCRFYSFAAHTFTYMSASAFNGAVHDKSNNLLTDLISGSGEESFINTFNNVEQYKTMILDDIYDMYECLKKKYSELNC